MRLLVTHKDSMVCFPDWSSARSLPKDIHPVMFSEKTDSIFIPIRTGHLVDCATQRVIDWATCYNSHSPVTQHQVFQSLFKACRKNNPKSSTPSTVRLGQDEKQIHIYQSLNKKTINHWKYLMQSSEECLLKANSSAQSYSGIQGEVKYRLSLQIHTTYT